ncbi:unnamed protein product, partial [Urochloa humidicola]
CPALRSAGATCPVPALSPRQMMPYAVASAGSCDPASRSAGTARPARSREAPAPGVGLRAQHRGVTGWELTVSKKEG